MQGTILYQILLTSLFIQECLAACSSDASNIQVTNGDRVITVSWSAASGPAPIVYDFLSTIDGSTPHNDLTDTSFEFTDLDEGMTFDASFEVTAKCAGVASSIVSENTVASTKPATPILSVLVDSDLEVLLGFNFTGQADSFTLNGSGIPEGSITLTGEETYLVEGLEKDNTYMFEGYITLNGINSDNANTTHTTSSKTTIAGLDPWTFAIIMIVVIVIVAVIIVVLIIVLCCVFRRKNGDDDDSVDGVRKGEDGEDVSTEQQQAWEYKDPYATVEYKVNEATRKRALAIAIQNAAIKN